MDNKKGIIYSSGLKDVNENDNISIEIPGIDQSLQKTLKDFIEKKQHKKTPRITLGSDSDDNLITSNFGGVVKLKRNLLPDEVIKSLRVQNHLIASIARARANTISMFGHPRANRLDIGFEIVVKNSIKNLIRPEDWKLVQEKIDYAKYVLYHCGHERGLPKEERMLLDEFLYLSVYDGITLGRFATEIIYEYDENKKTKKFHRFRPVDAATIYKTYRKEESLHSLRMAFVDFLIKNGYTDIDPEAFYNDEYAYAQIINGYPQRPLTADEMLVVNLYPTNDIEYNGYPVTPIDTTLNSITSHLSIDIYNRLYFQHGRAAKGILVVTSEDLDKETIDQMRHDFIANINSVGNAFRVPIFGLTPGSAVQWMPITSSSGDGEFMFLYDSVARSILTAFGMSPDELPGMGHLSRGTNQRSLSESDNEFKLIAARDTGLRPLILKIEAFLNKMLEFIDPDIALIAEVKLSGLDAETKEQEAVRLSQEMPIHMDYDEVLSSVEKKQVGPSFGGRMPFNERWQIIVDKYLNVGDILSEFMENPSALVDPLMQYKRDPFWMQFLQLLMQVNPAAVKALFSTKPYTYELLKFVVQDYLDESIEDDIEEEDYKKNKSIIDDSD